MNIKRELTRIKSEFSELIECAERGVKTSVFGLKPHDAVILSCALSRFVFVASDIVSAYSCYGEFTSLGLNAVLLPARDNLLMPALRGADGARYKPLYEIASGIADIVVVTSDSLLQIQPRREDVLNAAITVTEGEELGFEAFVSRLAANGYRRGDRVEEPCEFAVRGEIVDVWLPGGESYRIDFFGDTVDEIKHLNVHEMTSSGREKSIAVYPAREVFYSQEEGDAAVRKLEEDVAKLRRKDRSLNFDVISKFMTSLAANSPDVIAASALFPHESLNEFCSLPMVFEDAKKCYDSAYFALREHKARFKRLYSACESPFCSLGNLYDTVNPAYMTLCFHRFDSNNRFFQPEKVFKFNSLELSGYMRDYDALSRDINAWKSQGFKVIIGANIRGALDEFGLKAEVEYVKPFDFGGMFLSAKTVFIGEGDVVKKHDTVPVKRGKALAKMPSVGDFVVHEQDGVGMVESIGKVTVGTVARDYVVIKYAGSDKLYVPVENIAILSKYDTEGDAPKLNRLGGAEFARVKERVKSNLKAFAMNLVALYSEREKAVARKFSTDNSMLDEFAADFPYEETPDQLSAVDDVLKDLTSGKVMDRLICGDVGFGKTEIALRAAFKVICEGGQVAFMSPTTVLCRQHFETAKNRMEKFGVKIAMLNRFTENPAAVLKGLESGAIDIVIGTHRLLGKDIKYKDLQLLILDEEQKFGVEHKEKIKEMKKNINVLTLSATPIPRTLHMALSGIRDVSVLDTPPIGRLPAQVYVAEYSDALVVDAVEREKARGGQIFIVYNYVTGGDKKPPIEEFVSRLRSQLSDVSMVYAHGQMDKKELENAIDTFSSGRADVLVATTIIENGVDIPRANTLIVYGAERMGLAQLYQLKGRVGRNDRVAQVYFTFAGSLTEAAVKRLETMNDLTELGSGMKVAEADLRLRGAGDVFGAQQSGHVNKVGYELYCKLLQEAVSEAKGETVRAKVNTRAEADFDTFIPKTYCDGAMRMNVYRRIAELDSFAARDTLIADLIDACGKIPASVKNLATVGLLKNLAQKTGCNRVFLSRSGGKLEYENVRSLPAGFQDYGGVLNATGTPTIVFAKTRDLANFLVSAASA